MVEVGRHERVLLTHVVLPQEEQHDTRMRKDDARVMEPLDVGPPVPGRTGLWERRARRTSATGPV